MYNLLATVYWHMLSNSPSKQFHWLWFLEKPCLKGIFEAKWFTKYCQLQQILYSWACRLETRLNIWTDLELTVYILNKEIPIQMMFRIISDTIINSCATIKTVCSQMVIWWCSIQRLAIYTFVLVQHFRRSHHWYILVIAPWISCCLDTLPNWFPTCAKLCWLVKLTDILQITWRPPSKFNEMILDNELYNTGLW